MRPMRVSSSVSIYSILVVSSAAFARPPTETLPGFSAQSVLEA
jgi:hypothetical protein